MGEGNQSDTQILNNFVETLSAPLQQAMAEGSPKVVVESVTSVVNSLEPELAAAFRSGNPSVIQAVLGGATTTQMVVNDLIRTGSSLTGLPPGVQQLVDQRVKEIQEKQAAENDALKKLVAGTLGVAVMASTAEAGMYYGGEGSQKVDYSKSVNEMNAAERMMYFSAVASMSKQEFDNLSAEQKTQIRENNITQADILTADAIAAADTAYKERMSKLSADQQVAVTGYISGLDALYGKDGTIDDAKFQGFINETQKIDDPAVRVMVVDYANIAKQKAKAEAAKTQATSDPATQPTHANQTGAAQDNVAAIEAQKQHQQAAQEFTATMGSPTASQEQKNAAVEAANALGKQGLEARENLSTEVVASQVYTETSKAMQAANYAATNATVSGPSKAVMEDDFTASAATAQTRAPTITATALGPGGAAGLAQLGAPETVAANDVPGIEGPQQRRTLTASMGAGA